MPKPPAPRTAAQELAAFKMRRFEDHLYGQVMLRLRAGRWMAALPERQFRFLPTRQYRADLAFVGEPCPLRLGLIVEIDGEGHMDALTGKWVPGGHHRTKGREADLERDALAMIAGWQVLRVTPKQVTTGLAIEWIARLIGADA